ncbi:hypothetical protein Tco_1184631 [Tanacetum coccineum]
MDEDVTIVIEGTNVEGAKDRMMMIHIKRIKENVAVEDSNTNLPKEEIIALLHSSIVDHYLANKMQKQIDVAESNQRITHEEFVLQITPKIEKLVIEQLESEVLVRSSKEANMSHAVAANLSELELKKILINKMEANT